MICKQCEAHILRDIARYEGRTVNCLAYGCDTFNEFKQYCDRNDIVSYCIKLLHPLPKGAYRRDEAY